MARHVTNIQKHKFKNKILEKLDGWGNVLTGLAIKGKDKRTGRKIQATMLTEFEVEELYAGDDMARKSVDLLAEDMLREGWRIISPDVDDDTLEAIMDKYDSLGGDYLIQQAVEWSRLYGGCGILLGIDDGNLSNPAEPLDTERIKDFNYATLFHRYELVRQEIEDDPLDPNFGMPRNYRLSPRNASSNPQGNQLVVDIHYTRILRFDGDRLPRRLFIENGYWSDSILSKMENHLYNYNSSYDSVAVLMQDFAQSIFKIKDLSSIVAAKDGEAKIQQRVRLVEATRSLINAAIIDAEDEAFERQTTSMQNLDSILGKFEHRLVQASGYPHTVFLGEAPGGGLGDGERAETRDYYDFVSRQQELKLKPQLMELVELIMLDPSGPTGGEVPEVWDIEFNPLWQPDQKEVTQTQKTQAETDAIYINSGVLDPDEVAVSRFGTGSFSYDTTLVLKREEESTKTIDDRKNERIEQTQETMAAGESDESESSESEENNDD